MEWFSILDWILGVVFGWALGGWVLSHRYAKRLTELQASFERMSVEGKAMIERIEAIDRLLGVHFLKDEAAKKILRGQR